MNPLSSKVLRSNFPQFFLIKRLLAAELRYRLKLEEIQKTGDPQDLGVSDPVIVQGVSKIAMDRPVLNPRSAYVSA